MNSGGTMLRFWEGSPLTAGRAGLLPGVFNPPTLAHAAMAQEGRAQHDLDQIVFVLPEAFPHKDYQGATFEDRLAMLRAGVGRHKGYAVASSDKGLFIDIARQAKNAYGPGVEICLICGRDAAERIVGWDYGKGPAFAEQLKEFQLLVASRRGAHSVPAEHANRIHTIDLPVSFDAVSSTRIRETVSEGGAFEEWVDRRVAEVIQRRGLYRRQAETAK